MLKAALFDLDNTLCNSTEAIVLSIKSTYEKYITQFGIRTLDDFIDVNQKAFEDIYYNSTIPSHAKPILTWMRFFELLGINPSIKDFFEIIQFQKKEMLKDLQLYEGAKNALNILSAENIRMAVLTNGPFEDQCTKLIHLGISSYFDYLVSPDIALASKPKIRIYQYALHLLNVIPEEAVMIGNDTIDDLQGAKAIGMCTILIKNSTTDIQEKKLIDFHIPTIAKLPSLLESIQ